MTPTYEEAGTTAEPPVCPECGGSAQWHMAAQYEYIPCPACDATGYQRGDDASLIASCPDTDENGDVDFGMLFLAERESIMRQMAEVQTWERVG